MAVKTRNKLSKSSSKSSSRKNKTAPAKKTSINWSQVFRFGESYSSLLLGVLVVIITTILLVFLVRDRNLSQNKISRNISSTNTEITSKPTEKSDINDTITPVTSAAASVTPKATITQRPTYTVKPTNVPTKTIAISIEPTKKQISKTPSMQSNEKIHSVTNGENLWTIAEKYYKSGYNWVDIARVNNLSNPGVIRTGMKLTIPNVVAKSATIQVVDKTDFGAAISGTTYKVVKGDHLWGIAVRAYNDGFRWVEIAKINNIKTPGVIQPGLVLKIPRTAPPSQK